MYFIRKIFNPTIFQGKGISKNYFEGWYHKHVSPGGYSFAAIGGLAFSRKAKGHAFIQFIRGSDGATNYFKYPLEKFTYNKKKYYISIGPNIFSDKYLKLDIKKRDLNISCDFNYKNNVRLKRSFLQPGIMGWYRFVPRMECYHGVVSLHHKINGKLFIEGKSVDFSKGTGYIEKDWGSSMPDSWVWLQANCFKKDRTSLMLSIATIPWMGSSFPGFLGIVYNDNKQYRFATYTGATIAKLNITGKKVLIKVVDSRYLLKIVVERKSEGFLKAPIAGDMERRIAESIDARVNLELQKKDNKEVLYQGTSEAGGFEIVGDIKKLTQKKTKSSSS